MAQSTLLRETSTSPYMARPNAAKSDGSSLTVLMASSMSMRLLPTRRSNIRSAWRNSHTAPRQRSVD